MLFKRGLRQLRLKVPFKCVSPKLPVIDKAEIRKKVQSLHEFEEDDIGEWGVGSKFQLEAFQLMEPKKRINESIEAPRDLSIETVIKFISESSASDNLKLYEGNSDRSSQIILSLPSTPSRKALLQTILTAFKPLFPKRSIAVDGESEKTADWIVIDLKSVLIHIFDPQTRLEIDLDGKLESEIGMKSEESLPKFIDTLCNSLPRSIASRPNFIDKFNNRRANNK